MHVVECNFVELIIKRDFCFITPLASEVGPSLFRAQSMIEHKSKSVCSSAVVRRSKNSFSVFRLRCSINFRGFFLDSQRTGKI